MYHGQWPASTTSSTCPLIALPVQQTARYLRPLVTMLRMSGHTGHTFIGRCDVGDARDRIGTCAFVLIKSPAASAQISRRKMSVIEVYSDRSLQ